MAPAYALLAHQPVPKQEHTVASQLIIQAMDRVPMVSPGDNLQQLVETSLVDNQVCLQNGDILVLAQKIVSKSEGCLVDLNQV